MYKTKKAEIYEQMEYIIEILGYETVMNELFSYFTSSDMEDFTEHIKQMWEV